MMRFPDEKAGYYTFQHDYDELCDSFSLCSPYHANPKENYKKEITFSTEIEEVTQNTKKIYRSKHNHIPKGVGYVFKTRTKFDAEGNLISARYGKIYAPPSRLFYCSINDQYQFDLCYYLNPTDNDTNLEFDPDQNLYFDGISRKEQRMYQNDRP